ncbi:copper chaperone PCu(A)C [Halomonas sp. M4R1S46]|uniref:copper chaperone PCu(A)C n=1 Tax=Halomonas sp. M4R1S46 TaxID=2982692 RepID=UPI0021E3D142|nr:copper chaperone PCu(A)C [Halomonas sp. M4R1S46]UYG07251.1 copper chaperone PCu(A)C [Halomonas sp. M4R1S46]
MTRHPFRLAAACLLATGLLPSLAAAHEQQAEDLRIAHPFATPTPPGAMTGGAYLDIEVTGDRPAVLVGARSPASDVVEIHHMTMTDGTMRMRPVPELRITPDAPVRMRPGGGHHLMLIDLRGPLAEGDHFPLTLEFAERGEVEVEVWVQDATEGSAAADGHHGH